MSDLDKFEKMLDDLANELFLGGRDGDEIKQELMDMYKAALSESTDTAA